MDAVLVNAARGHPSSLHPLEVSPFSFAVFVLFEVLLHLMFSDVVQAVAFMGEPSVVSNVQTDNFLKRVSAEKSDRCAKIDQNDCSQASSRTLATLTTHRKYPK